MTWIMRFFFFLSLILIKIGDGVIWLFKRVVKEKRQTKVKLRRKKKPQVVYLFPISFKLKYFLFGLLFSFVFIFLPLLTLIFLQELPDPRLLAKVPPPQTTKIYDRNGILLYEIYINQNRTFVPLGEIPKSLVYATIAIEDKDFYRHPGFDVVSTLRAIKKTVFDKDPQGGSTITQQLVRASFLTRDPSIKRKFREIVLAFWAERLYTKDQILEMYLNRVPYGGTAWGVEAASETYFGKSVKDLTLAESALLAGLPAAPSIYSPFGSDPGLALARQAEVLNRMVSLGFITIDEAKETSAQEIVFRTPNIPIKAPHFVLYVKNFLAQKYGLGLVEQGGLKIITSLDLKTQDMAEKVLKTEIENLATLNVTNGALVVTDPKNGDILAMLGSKDYFGPGGNFNVTLALRQPGSAIKAVTYAAAFEQGFTAATILEDSPATFSSSQGLSFYSPVNYDGQFHGRISLRSAFANSYNVPAVRTLNTIGIDKMLSMGEKLGIKSWDKARSAGLSLTLGGGEVTMLDLATVYGTLADSGVRNDLNPILKVTDFKGDVVEEKKPGGQKVLDSGIAFILSNILSDNGARSAAFGPTSVLNIPGRQISVKTGTSDNKRDNWTIGYTKNFLTAVWVGNNDNTPMSPTLTSGVTGAAPIWNKIMSNLLEGSDNDQIISPPDVIAIPCLGRTEYFIKGTEKGVTCKVLPTPIPTPEPSP